MKITNKQALLLLTLSARFMSSAAECTGATAGVLDDVCSLSPDKTSCGYLPGCNWNGRACVGTDCSRYKNANSCNNELGCYWMDGNVGDYFPPPDDVQDEMDFDHNDVSDWMDQGLGDIWSGDMGDIGGIIGDIGSGPSGPYQLSSTESTKEYRVNLAVKTILFTLLAVVCLVGVVMISKKAKGGDSDDGDNAKEDEKNAQQKDADDDDQDMTIDHDEEEGRSWDEI